MRVMGHNVCKGSSPLARGLLWVGNTPRPRGGIIPARAGFTCSPRSCCAAGRDHPRSRGVYSQVGALMIWRLGSSPLARGLRRLVDAGHHGFRIIPARAGFTRAAAPPPARSGDHPRSRGVYAGSGSTLVAATGSSPLARGLPLQPLGEALPGWIIPARAGFTPCRQPCRRQCEDHPRSRGVYRRSSPPSS